MKTNYHRFRTWFPYITATIVTGAIALAGYLVGRNRPVPPWIETFLIPALGWLGVVLIVLAAADWLRQRRRAGRKPPEE